MNSVYKQQIFVNLKNIFEHGKLNFKFLVILIFIYFLNMRSDTKKKSFLKIKMKIFINYDNCISKLHVHNQIKKTNFEYCVQ